MRSAVLLQHRRRSDPTCAYWHRRILAGLLAVVQVIGFASTAAAHDMAFPGRDWDEATPASQSLDGAKVATAVAFLAANSGRDGVRELAIVRRGRLVWKGDDIDKVHGVWSCTKSFTSTVLGLLIDDGKCSLDAHAADFAPELADHYAELRLRHLATMTSGYRAVGDEPQGSYKHGPSRTPFRPADRPLFTPPGSRYAYWDSAMNLFGLVLTRIARETLEEVFRRRIAEPIGMDPKRWGWGDYATVDGLVVNGGSGNGNRRVTISAREMARFGHLFLNGGNWGGRQLLSRAWVEAATAVQVAPSVPWAQPESEIDGRGVYGFNWWTNGVGADGRRRWPDAPPTTFAASGHNNNKLFVIPEWKMVVGRLGLDEVDGKIPDAVWSRFLAMLGESRTDVAASDRGRFRFRHHSIERDLPGDSYGQTSLADIDRDGDLDFITGGKDARRTVYWFEYQQPDTWVRHVLGTLHPSDVGGTALDVDGDGWIDHVAGGVWYRNTGRPRTEEFRRIVFDPALGAVHDLVAADLDRDGRLDIVTMSDKNNLRWYRVSPDPGKLWERVDIGAGVHAGVAVGDIDGDGDPDVMRSNAWFENADGLATAWVEHPVPFGNPRQPYPNATRCRILDLDRDGDADLVMTENEIRDGRVAWLENVDGRGRTWTVHALPRNDADPRGAYHSLAVADFDNDGDADIFSVEMEGIPGARSPRWFVWENADGKGGEFVEHVIFDGRLGGHEAVVADVDGDGDLDICSKLWRPRRDNANDGRNHADFLENLLIERREADRPADGPRGRPGDPPVATASTEFPPPETRGGWRTLLTSANDAPTDATRARIREVAGLDWDRLHDAWSYSRRFGGPGSVVVIRHGWIAGEWFTDKNSRGIASCTKSLTGLAVAKLCELSAAGRFAKRITFDEPAWKYLPPSWAEQEPRRKAIAIRHMLTMTSGLDPYDGPYKDLDAYADLILTRRVEAPPGEVWAYASAPVDLLSLIVEDVSGQLMGDFFNEHVGRPIGAAPIEFPEFRGHKGGSGGPQGGPTSRRETWPGSAISCSTTAAGATRPARGRSWLARPSR